MQHYNLEPPKGWTKFGKNAKLANFIYDFCLPKVNQGGWSYINPMSGTGIFEDGHGNYLCLETQDIGQGNIIIEMHIGLNEGKVFDMVKFTQQIQADFGLLRSVRA